MNKATTEGFAMKKCMKMMALILSISLFFAGNAFGEIVSQSDQKISLCLSDFTHSGGYWTYGCSDDQVIITEFIDEIAENEKIFFYYISPRCAGHTVVWFEFYQSDADYPWFYIECVIEISEGLEMTINRMELVPCWEDDYDDL